MLQAVMNLSQVAESDARREEAQLRVRHHAALIAGIVCRVWQGRTQGGGRFMYHIRTTSYQLVCTWYEPDPKIRICRYLCTRATSQKKKRTEGLLMTLLQKNKIKNNLNTELTEMVVFSAVAGNQLPNQLQKRVLPALFHQRYPSQSHQRSARGRTRLTTVTSISGRSF